MFIEAIELFESIDTSFTIPIRQFGIHALCHYHLSEIARAQEIIEKGLLKYPDAFTLLVLKLNCSIAIKDYKLAIDLAQKLFNKHPKSKEVLFNLAYSLSEDGQIEEAIKIYKKILSMAKTQDNSSIDDTILDSGFDSSFRNMIDINALNNLGYERMKIGEYTEAIENFNQLISMEKDYAFAYNNRGFAYIQLGETDKGIIDIEHSLSLEPENSYVHKNKALFHLALGNDKLALVSLMRARELGFEQIYGNEVEKLIAEVSARL
jgi:tetratricopeptide (TPR) repeat protein